MSLLLLVYANDMTFAVDASLLFYAGSSCLQDKVAVKAQLNNNFENICKWLSDKKLHIHFVENKTNLIFGPKHKMKCQAFMVLKVISKANSVLKFLCQVMKSASLHHDCSNHWLSSVFEWSVNNVYEHKKYFLISFCFLPLQLHYWDFSFWPMWLHSCMLSWN